MPDHITIRGRTIRAGQTFHRHDTGREARVEGFIDNRFGFFGSSAVRPARGMPYADLIIVQCAYITDGSAFYMSATEVEQHLYNGPAKPLAAPPMNWK